MTANNANGLVMGNSVSSNNEIFFSGGAYFLVRDNAGNQAVSSVSDALDPATAAFWTFTVDSGGNWTFYRNGVSIDSGSGLTNGIVLDRIAQGNGGLSYLGGTLADLRIHGFQLSGTDVSNLYAGQDVSSNLFGYWAFAEGSGTSTVNYAPFSYTGTGVFNGGVTWNSGAPAPITCSPMCVTNSLNFDAVSTQYVETGSTPPLPNSQNDSAGTSISFWAYYTDSTQNGLFTEEVPNGSYWNTYTGGGALFSSNMANATTPASGSWHNFVFIWRNFASGVHYSQSSIYVDGTLVGTCDASSMCTARFIHGGNFAIAGEYPTYYFTGNIADVRIYNRSLDQGEFTGLTSYTSYSSADIAWLYAGGNVTLGLVGEYDFHEGAGSTLHDIVGTNDGTLNNGPTWDVNIPTPLTCAGSGHISAIGGVPWSHVGTILNVVPSHVAKIGGVTK